MIKMSMMPRLAIAAAAALIGLVALGASALAQPALPHQFYGGGLSEGQVVGLGEASATADASGNWSIQTTADVAEAADENSFTLDGKAATAELTSRGATLTEVALTVAMMEDDDSMMEDGDSMMEDDDSMMEDDDSMMEDDDAMLDEDDSMGEDVGMPSTGTGGLADGGVSAGLIGLLIALGAAAIAGLGYRRIRNRA